MCGCNSTSDNFKFMNYIPRRRVINNSSKKIVKPQNQQLDTNRIKFLVDYFKKNNIDPIHFKTYLLGKSL